MLDRQYYFNVDNKQIPNLEAMLAKLLDENILFCNSRKYMEVDNKTLNPETIVLFVNLNDQFCLGADATEITDRDLPILFDHYQRHGESGVTEWAAIYKIGFQPIKRIKEIMIKENIWSKCLESLKPNPF